MLKKTRDNSKGVNFGLHPGDLGVVFIAAIFTAAFVLILFSNWKMPSLSKVFSAPPAPKAATTPGETEVILFPLPAAKSQKKP